MKTIIIKADSRITLLMSTESGKIVQYEVDTLDCEYLFNIEWVKDFNDNYRKIVLRTADSIIDRILEYQYDFIGEYIESNIVTDLPTVIVGAVVTHIENKKIKKQKFYWGD